MDEKLKKNIYWFVLGISALILLFTLFANYKASKQAEDDYIPLDRSPLHVFRLIDYRETSDGVFIDVVGVQNGKRYENNLISKSCPRGKEKKPGMLMQLSVVENMKTSTQEVFYTLDRAYDYICTNKNMAEEDAALLKRIEEARNRAMQANSEDLLINK